MKLEDLDDIDKSVDLFLENLERMKYEEASKKETEEVVGNKLETEASTNANANGESNLPAVSEERKTFYIINNLGLWEEIDAKTGTTVSIQKKMSNADRVRLKNKFNYLEVQHPEDPNKTILVDRRLNTDDLKLWRPKNRGMAYSVVIADIIIDRIVNGESLKKISESPDMPSYSIIRRWRNEHPEFDEAYHMATRMRAEKLIDEALDIARETEDPENIVGTAKLLIDQLKYVAQQEDPKKYSQKANIQDGNGNNVVFNIISGIPDSSYTEKIANRKLDDQGKVVELNEPEPKAENK
jgi:hypothetical protein